jgi:predicted acyltransferase
LPATAPSQRYYALDVFRGATVCLMILVNNPGSWSYIYSPLKHAAWEGCTPTDLVFPFFLFAVGNALAFVLPKMERMGHAAALAKILKRGVLIFLIGLLLNWYPFIKWDNDLLVGKPFSTLRIFGVLQRIALAYTFAALLIYFFKVRGAFYAAALILLGYWIGTGLSGYPAPDGSLDPFSLEGFWGTNLDRALLGADHMYKGEGVAFDPEGIASTIPAIAQVIFGFLVGDYIRQKGKNEGMVANLFVAGIVLWVTGMAWGMVFPINKKIWSSSYVLYTSGLAAMALATFIQLIEFHGWKGYWSRFFDVFGKNPLFIFVLSAFVPKTLALIRIANGVNEQGQPKYTGPLGWFYENLCKPVSDKLENGSLLYAIIIIIIFWSIAWYMDKRKWYVKV